MPVSNSPQILKGRALGDFEAQSTGLEIVRAMAQGRIQVPYMQTLGMEFLGTVDEGHVELVLPVADWLREEDGRIPSGAMLSIMDAAGGLAARSILPKGKSYLVASFQAGATNESMDDKIENLHAIATVRSGMGAEEGLILARVELRDGRGRLLGDAMLQNAILSTPPASRKDEPGQEPAIEHARVTPVSFADMLGLVQSDEGVSIQTSTKLHNSIGTMHGGAILSALAEAAYRGEVVKTLRDQTYARLCNISATYLRPVTDDLRTVAAVAYPVKPGSIISSAGAGLGPAGKELAKGECGFRILSL
jgi:uncharacterized protein (TIGR00369 family)